jgi:hypothetical protein
MVADQENGLKYLQNLITNGVKLTAEQMKTADQALGFGSGFTKSLFETQQKALALKTQSDQITLQKNIIDLQNSLPEGKSIVIGGNTYTSMTDPTKDIQIFSETNSSGQTVIIEYNKKTRKVTTTNTGVTTKATTPPGTVPTTKEGKVEYYFASVLGPDMKVSPQDWGAAKAAYIKDGGNATTFDTKFKGYQDPNNSYYQ